MTFVGLINSPVSWSERDRTVKITVLSQIEDLECGFSAEEGNFPLHPGRPGGQGVAAGFRFGLRLPGAVHWGPPWRAPCCKGSGSSPSTARIRPSMVPSRPMTPRVWRSLPRRPSTRAFCSACLSVGICADAATSQKYLNQANAIYAQIGQQEAGMVRAAACAQEKRVQQYDRAHQLLLGSGANPVQILGGEDFPQNQTVTLDIKGGALHGPLQGGVVLHRVRQRSHGHACH